MGRRRRAETEKEEEEEDTSCVTTGEALVTYRKRRRDIYKYTMRNLLPSSRSLARTKTFFSSSFTVREDEFNDKSGFVGGEDEESQQERRRKSQQRKTTNTISCAPSLDEERKHVFV